MPKQKITATQLAFAACRQLIAAYKAGERNGGSVDWSDIDDAEDLSKKAVRAAARERKKSKA